jgi:hypothetical protein
MMFEKEGRTHAKKCEAKKLCSFISTAGKEECKLCGNFTNSLCIFCGERACNGNNITLQEGKSGNIAMTKEKVIFPNGVTGESMSKITPCSLLHILLMSDGLEPIMENLIYLSTESREVLEERDFFKKY